MTYETQRKLICELGRRMWERGWVAANDGNLSRRLGEGLYLFTPAGVSKGFLAPDMLVVVDGEGRAVDAGGGLRPSSETILHLECYRRRPDIAGVCHAHPPAATAFACARMGLEEPLVGEAALSLGRGPCAPYARTGTAALAEAAGPLLEEHDAVLLANHGAVTLGADLENAYWRMETLEHTARICLNVRLLGGGVPLSPEQAAELEGG